MTENTQNTNENDPQPKEKQLVIESNECSQTDKDISKLEMVLACVEQKQQKVLIDSSIHSKQQLEFESITVKMMNVNANVSLENMTSSKDCNFTTLFENTDQLMEVKIDHSKIETKCQGDHSTPLSTILQVEKSPETMLKSKEEDQTEIDTKKNTKVNDASSLAKGVPRK